MAGFCKKKRLFMPNDRLSFMIQEFQHIKYAAIHDIFCNEGMI